MIITQIGTIFGLAVVGHIGSKILVKTGQSDLAQYLDIVITVGASVWIVKLIYDGFQNVVNTFGVFL